MDLTEMGYEDTRRAVN